jgi:hypothetical protein
VKIINFDGMSFIGPGSEWFWTAISGLVLVVTFVAIYRQLRLMRSAGALEQLDSFERELASERMVRFELDVLVALRDGVDPLNLPSAAVAGVWRFWEKTGALARHGHLDPELLWEGSGTNVRTWWLVVGPYARRWRSDHKQPSFLVNFEWLADAMGELDRRGGSAEPLGGGPGQAFNTQDELVFACDQRLQRLRIEEALRAEPVVAPPGPVGGQPHRRSIRGSIRRSV